MQECTILRRVESRQPFAGSAWRFGTLSYVGISTQISNNVLNARDAIVILAQVSRCHVLGGVVGAAVCRAISSINFLVVGDNFYACSRRIANGHLPLTGLTPTKPCRWVHQESAYGLVTRNFIENGTK